MESLELRKIFFNFFEKRGHKIVQSSPLLPTDQSVLLTTAGMQQFKSYYTGESDALKDFGSLNTISIQKCIRTSDIDQIGDENHLSFFEMLGNFSFGGYFKEEAINLAMTFLVDKKEGMGIDHNRISVTYFKGDSGLPGITSDIESKNILENNRWFKNKIKGEGKDNFWGPTGNEGPCGPTVEFYIDGIEVWNIVFNQYHCNPTVQLTELKTPGVDTGMGLERLAMMVQKKKNIFETDLLSPIIEILPDKFSLHDKRIIVDHVRAASFLISDGVRPSNKEQGYILRRLLRRAIVRLATGQFLDHILIISKIVEIYKPIYENLDLSEITQIINEESEKFGKTLRQGLHELNKLNKINAQSAFKLYETYGLPYDVIKDAAGEKAKDLKLQDFENELKKHQELSRTTSAGMFKGGLANANDQTIKLHTAAHLMLEALKRVLGNHVQQKGSNINSERIRFDFSHNQKVSEEQLRRVEAIVNDQIDKKLPVHWEEMTLDEAKKIGATGVFEHKYGEEVKVYFIGPNSPASPEPPFSREICGGPHVLNTSELGRFKIIKEESVSSGVRRIKANIQ